MLLSWIFAGFFLSSAAAAEAPRILVASYNGIITPVAAEYLKSGIEKAEQGRYGALVIKLDTPGGLDLAMRDIVKAMMASRVPVIVYVSPAGARAASAGVFITMAAHVAAMAPGTNIGAAHPVQLGGAPAGKEAQPDKAMESKLTNDAIAYLEAIADKRGRNAQWAREAVIHSTSVTSAQALRQKVIDFEAESLPELLAKIDGRKIQDFSAPLRTKGAALQFLEMSWRQKILAAVSDPNIAMILMTLGVSGILIELYSPGLILPGIVGGASLILAFYAFQTLSANYAGILLIFLGFVLFLLELKITSFGLLALGGILSVLFGSLMLFQTGGELGLSYGVIVSTVGVMIAVMAVLMYLVRQAFGRRSLAGAESLKGETAVTVSPLDPMGTVTLDGELWKARSHQGAIAQGTEVEVVAVKGLVLEVRKKNE